MNMDKMIFLMLFLMFLAIPVHALSYQNCSDNETLTIYDSIDFNGNGYNFTENVYCEFGCYDNSCKANPIIADVVFIVFILIVGLIVLWSK